MQSKKIKVLHIIAGLQYGGAEMMLYKLLTHLEASQFSNAVISLTSQDELGPKIAKLGIPVVGLGMKPNYPNPIAIFRLKSIIKKHNPDLVQTWMYHANFLGGISAKLTKNKHIIWNIRKGDISNNLKRNTLLIAKISAILSHFLPETIVLNSDKGKEQHIGLGYSEKKSIVIPNGFDLSEYKPNPHAAHKIKEELGISTNSPLIGLIARFHPEKDHETFIQAASILSKAIPEAHYIFAGKLMTWQNVTLTNWIIRNNLKDRFHLVGLRSDIPDILAALDLGSLSSISEGFPNIIGETMACGVPFVTTDVGDAAKIVGNTGAIVESKNPKQLAGAWESLLKMDEAQKRAMSKLARQRIEQNYNIVHIASLYRDLYKTTLSEKRK